MFYLLYTKSIHKHDVVSKGPVDIKVNLFDFGRVQLGLLLHSLSIKQTALSKTVSSLTYYRALQDDIRRQTSLGWIIMWQYIFYMNGVNFATIFYTTVQMLHLFDKNS